MTYRLIVVERSQAVRYLLEKAFLQRGYEVMLFESLNSFLKVTERLMSPSLACCDFLLVDGSALETRASERSAYLEQLRCRTPHIAVIANGLDDEGITEVLDRDCTVLTKPLLLEPLCSWLEECESRIAPDRKLLPWPNLESESGESQG